MSGVVQKQVLFNRILQGVEYRLSGYTLGSGGCAGGPFLFSQRPFFIGGMPDYDTLKGWIDEIRISKGWRYEVPSQFNPSKRFQSDEKTVALWHFDEGPGALSYKDSSGNGYTLFTENTTAVMQEDKITMTWGQLKRN
jgi:hypothetical protein